MISPISVYSPNYQKNIVAKQQSFQAEVPTSFPKKKKKKVGLLVKVLSLVAVAGSLEVLYHTFKGKKIHAK